MRRHRDMVLHMRVCQLETKTFIDFLGCEPSSKRYLEWLDMYKMASGAHIQASDERAAEMSFHASLSDSKSSRTVRR